MQYYLLAFLPVVLPLATCLMLATSCEKDKADPIPDPLVNELKLEIQPVFGSQQLVLDSTYTTDQGWDIRFTDIKFYVTATLHGSDTLCQAALFDYRAKGNVCFQVPGTAASFPDLSAVIGVPQAWNHDDPTTFPTSSPLYSTNSEDMYWSWSPGFIFIKVEGKVDTIPDGVPLFDHNISYHVGTDTYVGAVSNLTTQWTAVSPTLSKATWQLDLHHLIDNPASPVDLRSESFTHSGNNTTALTQKVLTNFMESLTAP